MVPPIRDAGRERLSIERVRLDIRHLTPEHTDGSFQHEAIVPCEVLIVFAVLGNDIVVPMHWKFTSDPKIKLVIIVTGESWLKSFDLFQNISGLQHDGGHSNRAAP